MSSTKKFENSINNIREFINSISSSQSVLKERISNSIEDLSKNFNKNLKQIKKLKKFKKISKEFKKENKKILKELSLLEKSLENLLILKEVKSNNIEELKTNINILINVHSGKDI